MAQHSTLETDLMTDGALPGPPKGTPDGSGKTLPWITASLETGRISIIIVPLLTLEQQLERELNYLNIAYINLTNTGHVELENKLKEIKPQVIISSVEALGDKTRREILCKSRLEIGHIGWDEAVVSADPYSHLNLLV